jgi:hypothetical protein
MNAKMTLIREACITNVEEFFCNQVLNQLDQGNLHNAQSLHEEFVVNGEDIAKNWLFIEDLTEDEI